MGNVCHGQEVKEQEQALEVVAPQKKPKVPKLDEQVLDSADRYEVTYKRMSGIDKHKASEFNYWENECISRRLNIKS